MDRAKIGGKKEGKGREKKELGRRSVRGRGE